MMEDTRSLQIEDRTKYFHPLLQPLGKIYFVGINHFLRYSETRWSRVSPQVYLTARRLLAPRASAEYIISE